MMNARVAGILCGIICSGSVRDPAPGQTCEVYEYPPIPTVAPLPDPDVLSGEIALDWVNHTGSPGAYTSTFKMTATVAGTNKRRSFRFIQLRIKETSVVVASVALPDPLSSPVSIEGAVRTFSNNRPEKIVQLVAVSEEAKHPIWMEVLDESVLRTPDPLGSITLPDPTCVRGPSEEPCTVDVEWESTNVASKFNYLYVTVESPAWGTGYIWRRRTPDVPGADNSGNVKINEQGVTFRLVAADGFYTTNQFAELMAAGTVLDSQTAFSIPSHGVICPVDGLPMRRVEEDPLQFMGVLANGQFPGANPLPSMQAAGSLFGNAGVRFVRKTVRWDDVQPAEDGPFNWEFYDQLFTAYGAAGVEPWITLGGTPEWAGDPAIGEGCILEPNKTHTYPIKAEHLPAWELFVAEAVARYGIGGELALPCTNWEIYQEPDTPGQYCGTYEQWRDTHTRGYSVIKSMSPSDRVWAPNLGLNNQRDPDLFVPWLNALETSDFPCDGVSLHTFVIHTEQSLEQLYNSVSAVRQRLNQSLPGQDIPIAITACSYLIGTVDPYRFRRVLDEPEREQFFVDVYAILANAGADYAMWFNAVDSANESGLGILSPNLGPPQYHEPNPQYCGMLRIRDWLLTE